MLFFLPSPCGQLPKSEICDKSQPLKAEARLPFQVLKGATRMLIAIMIANIVLWSGVIIGLLIVMGRREAVLEARLAHLEAALADEENPQQG